MPNLDLMSSNGDGTIRCYPPPFYQIYSVHLDVDNSNKNCSNIVPVIYGLLPNKREATFIRFFNLFESKLGVKILLFKCDYEQAQLNAIQNVYPEAKTTGCFYHYNRAVWRKLKINKLNKTRSEINYGRLITLLTMLPPKYIQKTWKDILANVQMNTGMKKFITYFEKQWMAISFHKISVYKDNHRTKKQVEGWHRRVRARIPQSPNFYLFLYKIKKEI